jgi:polyphosphate kinase
VTVPELFDVDAIRILARILPEEAAFPAWTPKEPLPDALSIWDSIRRSDLFLHHPHDDFTGSVVRFFEEAADDPDVRSINVVLYRLGDKSRIAEALVRAARNGKRVFAAIELRARGDELRNAVWANYLEAVGVEVLRGRTGHRNHAKVALIERVEASRLQRYAHVGTGNYNAATAASYTDFGLFTTRPEVCDDLADVFDALRINRSVEQTPLRACLAGPGQLRAGLLQRIRRETQHARAGRAARIRMKMNGLADRECIEALYEASQAGVRVELIVRGVCTLRPGVPGVSDNIRVTSIIGRFLEHARVFAFDNGSDPEYFIGSADLRTRNLRRRVELLVPLSNPDICEQIDAILSQELNDPNAWLLNPDGSYRCGTLDADDSSQSDALDNTCSAPAELVTASGGPDCE